MRCSLLALAALVGCGRLGFGDHGSSDDARSTDGGDASAMQRFTYLKQSNTETFDRFGFAIAMSSDGNTIAIGAPAEDDGVPGVNASDGSDNSVSQAGAVYVFVRSGDAWQQQAYLKPTTIDMDDQFGTALALSADGNTLAVGDSDEDSAATTIDGNEADNTAPTSGAVLVFTRSGVTWSQQAYVKCSNCEAGDAFGWSVALSGTGDTLAVGATGEDSAAIGVDGDKLSNAAADSGAVYIFARTGQAWSEQTYIKAWNTGATDMFGFSVALSDNGTTLAVAAPQEDSAQAGVQNGNAYVENGNVPEAGAAYIYVYATGSWTSQAYIKPEFVGFGGDYFAHPLSLSGDGNVLACGAPGEDTVAANSGAVWMFRRTGTTWGQEGQLKASNAGDNDQFGATVAVSTSGSVMIGAPYEDSDATGLAGNQNDDSSADSGAVYAFGHTTSGWMQTTYGKASANDAGDQFGFTVAMSQDGTTRAATASFEDSTARGVDGDPLDNGAPDSGCAAVSFY